MQSFQFIALIFTVGFFICVGLYIYFMSKRMRKNAPVDFQLWVLVAVGLLLNIGAQLSEMAAGQASWASIKLNVLLTAVFVVYAIWRVYKIKKQPTLQSPPAKLNKKNKQAPQKLDQSRKKGAELQKKGEPSSNNNQKKQSNKKK